MKKLALALALVAAAFAANAQDVYHRGYTTEDGAWVSPHYQTAPNSSVNDNYSTQGNFNPYTGQQGTRPRQ